MEYRKVYFRIRSSYQFDSGWPNERDAAGFQAESRGLFQSVGWELHPGGNGISDTVTKGPQHLYLHPMNFSGIIQMAGLPEPHEVLKRANSFHCYGTDTYERYWELTDEDYRTHLESRRDEIVKAVLERYRTKRKNLYRTGPVALNIAREFSVHRLCDKEGKRDFANRFVGELIERLIQEGRLITAETKNGLGIRTATDAELNVPLCPTVDRTLHP